MENFIQNNVIYIYGLYNPHDYVLKYIGKTNNIKRRYNSHISNAKNGTENTLKANWIKSLLKENLKPIIKIIDITTVDESSNLEISYINKYKFYNLKNMTIGGDGGLGNIGRTGQSLSAEHKIKISKALTGRSLSEETKTKLSESHKGKCLSNETKLKMSVNRRGVKKTKSYSEKLSNRMKCKNNYNLYKVKIKFFNKRKFDDWVSIKVLQYDLTDNFIKEWNSIKEASINLNVSAGSISKVCKNKRNSCGGYKWKYASTKNVYRN